MTADYQLWRPDRRGTLILSDHRFGGHFLQDVILQRIPNDQGTKFEINRPSPSLPGDRASDLVHYINMRFDQCVAQCQYPILLINDAYVKLTLLANRNELDNWHKVRLTRRDKVSWFISWWLFIQHQNSMLMLPSGKEEWIKITTVGAQEIWTSGTLNATDDWDLSTGLYIGSWSQSQGEYYDPAKRNCILFQTKIWEDRQSKGLDRFHHHNTSSKVYEKYFASQGRIPITAFNIRDVVMGVADHAVSYSIPVHEELDYEDLPALSTSRVAWKQNHYPSGRLQDMFENTQQLERLLQLWSDWRPDGLFIPANGNE